MCTTDDRPGPAFTAPAERVMIDAAVEYIALLDVAGVVLEVNRAALALVGSARGDVVGRPFWDTPWWSGDAGRREQLRAAVDAAARGESVRYETTHEDTGGRAIAVDFSLTPVLDVAGGVTALVAEGRDVTERRRAEEALQVSEQRLAGIIALAPEAIISVDESQRIVLFNHGAERIFGWTAAEAIGQPLDLLLPADQHEAHRAHLKRMGGGGPAVRRMSERGEIHGRRRDGSLFPAEASISRFVVGGRPVLTAVLRDVTQRRAMEERDRQLLARESEARAAAEAAERRARFLAELSAELDSSLDLRVIAATLARQLAGRVAPCCVVEVAPRGAVAGVREAAYADAALAPGAGGAAHPDLPSALAPTSIASMPLRAHRAVLGTVTLLSAGGAPPLGAAELSLLEEVAARAAIAVDNARLYREAVRAAELRDRTLGVVSHDLRGPLSAIGLAVRGLEPLCDESDRAREAVQTVLDASHLMQRLIQDLLDVASIEAGGFRVERRPADLLLLLVRAHSLFEDLAEQRGVSLELELPDELPVVAADADRLLQVVTNLLDNALKFTAPGGRVVLRGEAVAAGCRVSVADGGAGIPADELPHVFDRFWHVRRGAPRRGTGLGLAISKEIVDRHGGTLTVESEVGRGTTFAFTVPVAEG